MVSVSGRFCSPKDLGVLSSLGMAPRVDDTSKDSLEFEIGNNCCGHTLLFWKGRFVSNGDGPFHRCVNAGSGKPREESGLSGILR